MMVKGSKAMQSSKKRMIFLFAMGQENASSSSKRCTNTFGVSAKEWEESYIVATTKAQKSPFLLLTTHLKVLLKLEQDQIYIIHFSEDKRVHGTSSEKQKIHNVSMVVKTRGNLHYSFSYYIRFFFL